MLSTGKITSDLKMANSLRQKCKGFHLESMPLLILVLQIGIGSALADAPNPVDFTSDVLPLMSRMGCNGASCHGKAEGQNGFKLSVFEHDPKSDFNALTMDSRGRRILPTAPEQSLLLRKITGEVGHGGGIRVTKETSAYKLLYKWIANGTPFSIEGKSKLEKVRLDPARRSMRFGEKFQLKVLADFDDGSTRDVSWLSMFHSNDEGMATVSEDGKVAIGDSVGQVSLMARYRGKVAVFQAIVPQTGPKVAHPEMPTNNFIDELVDRQLKRLNIAPSGLANDATFIRRAYLDLIGRLPTAREAEAFLKEETIDQRVKLVDGLLSRPEFADFWALRWSDLLRVDRLKLGHENAHEYYRWIHRSLATDKPLDKMVRELLTADGPLNEQPAGYFFRTAKSTGEMSAMAAQVFLGVRLTCAECHQHPYDRWTQKDYHAMRGFFQQVKTKESAAGLSLLADGNPIIKHPRTGKVIHPYPLGAPMPDKPPEGDRRIALSDWLTAPENPWFARNLANRIWANLLGNGLVMPVDDLRETNPPSNPELLDKLATQLIESKYDLKAMIRLITASRTYQLSSKPNESNFSDEKNFSRALFRRLPAEVLMDAVCDVTGVPEKYDGMPSGYRAVQLWDSQVRHYFLKLFGRPGRSTVCECERVTGATIAQSLHLMNSPNLQRKLSHPSGTVKRLLLRHSEDAELVKELYLACYSRKPTTEETRTAIDYIPKDSLLREKAVQDLAWSLLNSLEFIFNH
jgi:hypothetical protein